MYSWTDGTPYLMHHGIKGQRWGVRRFQNADGTLTEAGKSRLDAYKEGNLKAVNSAYDKRVQKRLKKETKLMVRLDKRKDKGKSIDRLDKKLGALALEQLQDTIDTSMETLAIDKMTYSQMQKEKRAIIAIGSAAAAVSLASLGSVVLGYSPLGVVISPDFEGILRNRRINSIKDAIKKEEQSLYN